jgi:FixJ family two-component response regulator
MIDQERRHLAQDRHIAECKELIARRQELIRPMAQRGQSTELAEGLAGEPSTFERHRKLIVAQLDAEK